MASSYSQISGANPWADGTVAYGDTKTIDVQFLTPAASAGSAGGLLCNQDWPSAPDGPMIVSGDLNVNMNFPISTMYFGYGYQTIGSYTQPTITPTGSATLTGSGAYDGTSFVNFINTTHNDGTLTIKDLVMFSGDANSVIEGSGTLNLVNSRLVGNIDNFNACMVGSITGGQTINMNGSDLAVYMDLSNVTINMMGGGNYLALRITNTVSNVKITGFGKGDVIDVPFTADADTWVYDPETGNLTITSTSYSHTVNIGLGYDPTKFASKATAFPGMQGVTYLDDAPCFLRGAMILTSRGEVAVEALQSGDMIMVVEGNLLKERALIAVKSGRVNTRLAANLPPDAAYLPVVIEANAFGNNSPNAELNITSDHCFAFDGNLIPIRTLVNGQTIRYNNTETTYDFFHLELEQHSIIIANGTESESFYKNGAHALPLNTDPSFVRAIYDRIVALAPKNSVKACLSRQTPTFEPLTIRVNGRPERIFGERHGTHLKFNLPAGANEVILSCETQRPCDVIGPFYDDRRYLGYLIGSMVYYGSAATVSLTDHLTASEISGWHDLELSYCRWTKENASVKIPADACSTPGILWIEVAADLASLSRMNEPSGLYALSA